MQHTPSCDDCIVTALLAPGDAVVHLADTEATALRHLAEAGMVAPLRLVRRGGDHGVASG